MKPYKGLHDVALGRSGRFRCLSLGMTTDSLSKWRETFQSLFAANIIIIARLNWSYHPHGTVPEPARYPEYVDLCREWVNTLMPYCKRFIIGNETNLHIEYPNNQPILVPDYARLFASARMAIKALLSLAEVMPAPPSPGVPGWQDYWKELVNSVEADAWALHTYAHNYTREAVWHGLPWRVYREALALIPDDYRRLPVYITEANGGKWRDYQPGWLKAAYDDIEWYNNQADTQDIHALILYAHDERGDGYGMAAFQTVMMEYDQIQEGNAVFQPPAVQPQTPGLSWDSRLDQRGAVLVPATVNPGQSYWKLVSAEWMDEQQSGGRHHIFMEPEDLPCIVWWDGGNDIARKDFGMYNAGTPYNIAPADGPADAVHHLGLGSIEQPDYKIHTSYRFRWERHTRPAAEVFVPVVTTPPTDPNYVRNLTHPIEDPAMRRVTQPFGANPSAYAQFGMKGHPGVDFGVPAGTPIRACDGGTVSQIENKWPEGLFVRIRHEWGETVYLHLSKVLVALGQNVRSGETIAQSGASGNVIGAHLDLMMRIKPWDVGNGYHGYIDPVPHLETGAPVTVPPTANDRDLLARLITSEAGGESVEGQLAVAWVVVNRMVDPNRWGDTISEVILAPHQFAPPADKATVVAMAVATLVLSGHTTDPVDGANHFHNPSVSPSWADSMTFVRRIGNHLFYRG